MHYDFTAIPDADVPQAFEPTFQHVVTTFASEASRCLSAPTFYWHSQTTRNPYGVYIMAKRDAMSPPPSTS
jgi:hypothetical protein